jgi:hypothetical protein
MPDERLDKDVAMLKAAGAAVSKGQLLALAPWGVQIGEEK